MSGASIGTERPASMVTTSARVKLDDPTGAHHAAQRHAGHRARLARHHAHDAAPIARFPIGIVKPNSGN